MIRIFDDIERFICGTVGEPGERAFFIQVRSAFSTATLSVEKSQVQALAERLRYMVKEIKLMHPLTQISTIAKDSAPLDTPIDEDFRVSSMALFFDDESELIQVDLRESGGDSDADFNSNFNSDFNSDTETDFNSDSNLFSEVEVVRIYISASRALAFADRADALMGAGRLPCPFCGAPINPTGHLCARANGYRR